jgi:hypothetical protein
MLREERANPNFKVINRQRLNFVYNDLPYSIDVYQHLFGREKTYILRFANLQGVEGLSLVPAFLKVEKNVRTDPEYSLKNIAKI